MKIYFKIKNKLRSFYWVELGKDHSVYFGSAAVKHFRKGYSGTFSTKKEGSHVKFTDGKPLGKEEIKGKYSVHRSGIIMGPHLGEKERKRYRVTELDQYGGPIPLVGIFPMNPTRYPETEKLIKKEDLIVGLNNSPHPLALLIYLKMPNYDDPLLVKRREKWDKTVLVSNKLGKYILKVFIYMSLQRFKAWPSLEINLTAQPDRKKQIPWPIFKSIP
ncbi:MAG: hypothetical protein K9L76_00120 [Candidatus Omnitrophica bacterium]|nr:hypothetical protein [Candidatus Omnitrophota bacterium]